MLTRVFLPQLGQTMEEGTIEKWHKQEGERVEKGDVLFELTTDKATLEVEAVADGVLKMVLVPEGETAPVNTLVGVIGGEEEELTEEFLAEADEAAPSAPATDVAAPKEETEPTVAPVEHAATPAQQLASPRARKVAEELKVPVAVLQGSGPEGRVIERDVLAYAEKLDEVSVTPAAHELACQEGVDLVAVAAAIPGRRATVEDVEEAVRSGAGTRPAGEGQRIPFTAMRNTIAHRMTTSKQQVPHFYLTGEILMRDAQKHAKTVAESSGQRVTVTAMLIKAVALGLQRHPRINARFDGDAAVLNSRCNVGVAVAVDDGLFVPVVKHADSKSLPQIAVELRDLAETARAGKLIPEQYEGGSITVSNLGMFGVDAFIPIINPPEACIIGVGRIKEDAIVADGGIRIESVMQISISADHRVVNGLEAAEFFRTIKELLEAPDQIGE